MMNAGQQLAAPIIADNLCIYGRNSKKKRKSRKKKIINHYLENYVNGPNFGNRRKIKSSEEWIFTFQENVFLPGRTILTPLSCRWEYQLISTIHHTVIQLMGLYNNMLTTKLWREDKSREDKIQLWACRTWQTWQASDFLISYALLLYYDSTVGQYGGSLSHCNWEEWRLRYLLLIFGELQKSAKEKLLTGLRKEKVTIKTSQVDNNRCQLWPPNFPMCTAGSISFPPLL